MATHAKPSGPARTAKYLLAIDQGTTGTTALVVTLEGKTLGRHSSEFAQHFPKPGWVEHDLADIWQSVGTAVTGALLAARIDGGSIAAIGITNQRETTVVWERSGGEPIHRAIVWQCRRTAPECEALRQAGHEPNIRKLTGLVIDAYFSATKIAWILDHVDGARGRADRGELAFGTIDSYVVHKLTSGSVHITDVTNASRTLLMNLETAAWDDDLLALFRVPKSLLPKIVGSAEIVGETQGLGFLPDGIPIAGIAGDQQAALFGQACFEEGDAKCTYGTGAFTLMNIGKRPIASKHGLVTTVAWKIGGEVTYALEGSAFIAGAAVQWLRDGLGIIRSASEVEALARQVPSSEGVVFVPALAGLGAPYWDPDARGTITGLTRGSKAAHIARATLEGIAFQVEDLLAAMAKDAGRPVTRLRVDGGASQNDLLLQFQADIANVIVERPTDIESTARGAAMLAGVGAGLSVDQSGGQSGDQTGDGAGKAAGATLPAGSAAARMLKLEKAFEPRMAEEERAARARSWGEAVKRARLHTPAL